MAIPEFRSWAHDHSKGISLAVVNALLITPVILGAGASYFGGAELSRAAGGMLLGLAELVAYSAFALNRYGPSDERVMSDTDNLVARRC